MPYRMLALTCLLMSVGCQKTTPSTPPPSETSLSSSTSPAASAAAPADPAAPVATLLGKPVYRRDFYGDVNPNAADVRFQSLILGALMADFCLRESVALTKNDADAFEEVWHSALERQGNKSPPIPPFDEAKTRTQLDEARRKLAAPETPWLERLTLQAHERGHLFALEHKSVQAASAYENLMPLRCQKAMYEKYGGKVVGMQISIEPVGAYLKLIEEAEVSGRLKFHDAVLEQSLRRRMNEYAQRQEVPPEFVDFSLPMWLQITLKQPPKSAATTAEQPARTASSKTENTPAPPRNDLDMLSRFVGVWQTRGTDKPSKWKPGGGESTVHEVTQSALKNRIIIGREHNQTDGTKNLWVMTYDEKQNVYPFWMFDSSGLMGGQWELTWDAATQTATGRATDTPAGWTSHATYQFSDDTTNNVHYWMKDDTGTLLMEVEAQKNRQPDETGAAYLAAWSMSDPPDPLPAELKLLDRMIGTWDAVSTRKPAAGAPNGSRATGTITRKWILNGRFVMGMMEMSDGSDVLTLSSFDQGAKEYRHWFFNSLGHRHASHGQWNEQAQTLTLTAAQDGGPTTRMSIRFDEAGREVWHTVVTDAGGKVYLDMESTLTRRSAAPATDGAAAATDHTDHERLQGMWGLVAMSQDGKYADAPIAPEDSAIKYVFQGANFVLVASGNAGASPKGSFKLGTSGNTKTIDLVFSPEDGGKSQVMHGVYRLEGDTLTIGYLPSDAKRPDEFVSAAGSKQVLTMYKRIKD